MFAGGQVGNFLCGLMGFAGLFVALLGSFVVGFALVGSFVKNFAWKNFVRRNFECLCFGSGGFEPRDSVFGCLLFLCGFCFGDSLCFLPFFQLQRQLLHSGEFFGVPRFQSGRSRRRGLPCLHSNCSAGWRVALGAGWPFGCGCQGNSGTSCCHGSSRCHGDSFRTVRIWLFEWKPVGVCWENWNMKKNYLI